MTLCSYFLECLTQVYLLILTKNFDYAETPEPKDDTVCEEGKENLVPYKNGICMELVQQPKKQFGDAQK